MMGLAEIKAANRRNSRAARREEPFVITAEQRAILATGDLQGSGIYIPNLGDYVPRGWKQTVDKPYFVDTSGWGDPGEPALTHEQFAKALAKLPEGVGIGLIEAGQFQAYVATYVRTKPRRKNASA